MKMMTLGVFGVLMASMSLSACAETTSTASQTVTAANTASHQVKREAGVWIDVRSAEEFATGHLHGALNITPAEIAEQIQRVEPNKDAPIHLYCRSGRRAEVARQTLLDMGYRNVKNHGGYDDLIQQGVR
ncbi:MAG: rhodanese-like domain-containing protein [Acinetobacter sp.]|nr:rhodanese-like domain-containing protein [Acinetobacter sp.]